MQRFQDVAQDALGNVIQGMSVSVLLQGTQTLATIFSDNGITTIPNPVTTDALGTYFFYAANGRYDLQLAKSGLPTTQRLDVLLFDPLASPVFSSITVAAGRTQAALGAPVASANNLTLGNDGNVFPITGTTQINLLNSTGWQAGSVVVLMLQGGSVTVKNAQAASGAFKPIIVATGADYVSNASGLGSITLSFDGTFWREIRGGI